MTFAGDVWQAARLRPVTRFRPAVVKDSGQDCHLPPRSVVPQAPDVRHRPVSARSAMMAGIRSQIDGMEAALPDTVLGDRRREVIGTYAAILGGLILARAADDLSL